MTTPALQQEGEANDGTSGATPVTLTTSGSTKFASVTGFLRSSGDLDYYSLGTVQAGQTVFLTSRKPSSSGRPGGEHVQRENGYVVESGSGRPFDGVARCPSRRPAPTTP